MADDTQDPREAVLVDIICEEGQCRGEGTPADLLARLDAADPLRQQIRSIVRRAMSETSRDPEVVARSAWDALREIGQAITATEKDDG